MIPAVLFFLHFIFMLVIFTKKWQDESISSAIMNVVLVSILFTVGQTIAQSISKAIMEQKGFGIYFDRDAFSLVILTIGELFFYKIYFKGLIKLSDLIADDTEIL